MIEAKNDYPKMDIADVPDRLRSLIDELMLPASHDLESYARLAQLGALLLHAAHGQQFVSVSSCPDDSTYAVVIVGTNGKQKRAVCADLIDAFAEASGVALGRFKRCRKCGRVKPLAFFHNHQRSKDGRSLACLLCERKRAAAGMREVRKRRASSTYNSTTVKPSRKAKRKRSR